MMENGKYDRKYFEIRRKELEAPFEEIKSDLQELSQHFYPRSVRFLANEVNQTNKKKNKKIKGFDCSKEQ